MKLLVVSPDYASHALPLLQVASEWAATVGEVVVATGPATRPLVDAASLAWCELQLGRGSNGGVIEVTEQPAGEDDHLRAFFAATRLGPIATLEYQADARRHDLLHDPDRVVDRLRAIVRQVRPDRVLVDHVAFGARLALHALGIDAASIVLGHPSALPTLDEVYGLPPVWPTALEPDPATVAALRLRCRASIHELEAAADEFMQRRAPHRPAAGDLTVRPGHPTIYVYPSALADPRRPVPSCAMFIGSLARAESLGDVSLPSGTGPRVTVALGSFLSARDDVLAIAVRAAHIGGWRLAIAHGSTPPERLGPLPDGALVMRHLPQVALLEHTDVVIHHGGNGSVTEAATAGVPMVVLPFSTDQFAGAEAVERVGVGKVLAPNDLTPEALAAAVDAVLSSNALARARRLAESIVDDGGAAAAVRAIAA